MAPRGGSKSIPTHEAALTTLTSTAMAQGDLLLRYMARVKELEALAERLLAHCDDAMHQDQQYADERGELIAIAQGNR